MTDAKVDMRPFWDTVNRALHEHDYMVQTPDGSVHHLVIDGYLQITARGVVYRSIPREHTTTWVAWEPYEIVGHFSQLTDPNATIEWVPHRSNEPGKVYAVRETTPEEYESL